MGTFLRVPFFSFMPMRVISGIWRSQPLRACDGVRATTDRVKEAVFSILGSAADLRILDLYAGSGSLGIEALSRGAKEAWFVDISKRSIACIKDNLAGKELPQVQVIKQDSIKFLRSIDITFDWIFCDPPYANVNLGQLIDVFSVSKAVGPETMLVLETDRFHTIAIIDDLIQIDRRQFGDTVVYFIGRSDSHHRKNSRA
ncbi:16S rRNA (guanine(966)-N(2))-methyltransferase RsmD [candidate division LCP-89 bacterium B3_LCP]|uniref:16S rRNA (Guanine(966)-N(2))-methyltransferase RsmD n=1 Tax=candidate division LCP-89 bacterium B3_LCP TaxID=2012998 RepID=A0A532V1L3_UNCL8|nr:MAG: 16S rRNA (guanine(966)-N(2))-methyltransferase RsmD [candidate division LCP-89 bacterium B3_LCP]